MQTARFLDADNLASLAGVTPARIRQLAPCIPGVRIFQRQQRKTYRFEDCPALRKWIAEGAKARRQPANRKALGDVATADLEAEAVRLIEAASREYAAALSDARQGVNAAIKCGVVIEQATRNMSQARRLQWVRENCVGVSPSNAQRYLQLARRSHRKLTDAEMFYQAMRIAGLNEKQARHEVYRLSQLVPR